MPPGYLLGLTEFLALIKRRSEIPRVPPYLSSVAAMNDTKDMTRQGATRVDNSIPLIHGINDVARTTGLSTRTIRRAIETGALRAVHPTPGRLMVLHEDLVNWLRAKPYTPPS
jgi:excisionase family DNA binding protein